MKTLKPTLIALTVAVAALTGMADSGHSEERGIVRRGGVRAAKAQTFSVSGSYSGLLSGDVVVSNRTVFIAPTAVIYSTTDGAMESGSVVSSSNVYLSGTVKNGDLVATIVIVSRDEGSDYTNMTIPSMSVQANRPR